MRQIFTVRDKRYKYVTGMYQTAKCCQYAKSQSHPNPDSFSQNERIKINQEKKGKEVEHMGSAELKGRIGHPK